MSVSLRAPVIALALVVAGCVSVANPDLSPAPSPDPGSNAFGQAEVKRPPATDLVIFVEFDGGKPKATPDKGYVESPTQNIRWYTNAADVRIEFKKGLLKPPDCEKGKKRCAMKLPGKAKGQNFEYDVILTDADGKEHHSDPRIIIDY